MLIIDSLLFSKNIPCSQCNKLVEKLEALSNIYFKANVKHIRNLQENIPTNKQLFYTIEILNEAISKGKQVKFNYSFFDIDKKLHPRRNSAREIREYIINQYQIVATNGRFYLICNYDKYDNVSHYRLDRITNIKLLDTTLKPKSKVKGLEKSFDLPKHMAEHIYMFAGESVIITFIAKRYVVNEVIDWFCNDAKLLLYNTVVTP